MSSLLQGMQGVRQTCILLPGYVRSSSWLRNSIEEWHRTQTQSHRRYRNCQEEGNRMRPKCCSIYACINASTQAHHSFQDTCTYHMLIVGKYYKMRCCNILYVANQAVEKHEKDDNPVTNLYEPIRGSYNVQVAVDGTTHQLPCPDQ